MEQSIYKYRMTTIENINYLMLGRGGVEWGGGGGGGGGWGGVWGGAGGGGWGKYVTSRSTYRFLIVIVFFLFFWMS
jgi:hypothetical protein